jgi:hypothetical protein
MRICAGVSASVSVVSGPERSATRTTHAVRTSSGLLSVQEPNSRSRGGSGEYRRYSFALVILILCSFREMSIILVDDLD